LEETNDIFEQARIKVVMGDSKELDLDESMRMIGGDFLLAMPATAAGRRTEEERKLTKNQRPDRFTVYYLGGWEGYGYDLQGHAGNSPALYLKYGAPKNTLAHELGHGLGLSHWWSDEENLMSIEGPANAARKLNTYQIPIMRDALLKFQKQ
jgi:hypothetical protein